MNTPLIAAFLLLFALTGAIGIVSKRLARGQPAPSGHDRSSALLGIAHTLTMVAGALFPWLGLGVLHLSNAVAWGADGAMVLAFALQMWAMFTLGRHFSLALAVEDTQPVIDRGPYRLVRHPGYLAQFLFFVAFGLATRNAVALAVIVVADLIAYAYRIRIEERLLVATLGARYHAYAQGRARLVPGLW